MVGHPPDDPRPAALQYWDGRASQESAVPLKTAPAARGRPLRAAGVSQLLCTLLHHRHARPHERCPFPLGPRRLPDGTVRTEYPWARSAPLPAVPDGGCLSPAKSWNANRIGLASPPRAANLARSHVL